MINPSRNTFRNIRDYYKQQDANKFDNLEEIDSFLEIYNPPKLNQEETNTWNRPIPRSEIFRICNLKTIPYKQKSQMNSTKDTKNLYQSLSDSFKRLKRREHFQTHSMKPPSV